MQNGKVAAQELGAIGAAPAARGPHAGRIVWDFWKAYAEKIAHYQTTVILSVIYGVIVGLIWAAGRLIGHQFLPQAARNAPSFWAPAHMGSVTSLDALKKQG